MRSRRVGNPHVNIDGLRPVAVGINRDKLVLSLQLAREAVARFPDSLNAPEFEWNVVKALANMERWGETRDLARIMVEKYPGNSFAEDVDRHLLNHPPNPPDTP